MLTEKHLNLASAIDNELNNKGLFLAINPDSPLTEIVPYVNTPYVRDLPSMEARDVSKEIIKLTMSIEEEGQVGYDNAMDRVVNDLAPKLSDFLSLAREQINPLIKRLSDAIRETVNTFGENDVLNGLEVKETTLPDFLLDTSFINLVQESKDRIFSNEPTPPKPQWPDLAPEDVRSMIANYPVVGKSIVEWIGDSQLPHTVYNGIFRHHWQDKNLGYICNYDTNALQNSVIAFVLSNIFTHEVLPGTAGSLQEYNSAVLTIKSQAALGIANYLEKLEKAAKDGILITSRTKKAINVNPLLYKEWISNGGNVDILYGLSLQNSPYSSIKEIEDNKNNLLTNWNSYKERNIHQHSSFLVNKVKEALLVHFTGILNDPDFDTSFGTKDEEAIEIFKELVSHIGYSDMDDLAGLVVKLVCRAKYPKTNVEVFLMGINEAITSNGTMDINEAALISLIKYVGSWVSQGISIEKK